MDFRELTYITAIADTGSLTAAAKKLYISQPALSQILFKIEQDAGVRLFDRSRYPIMPTYAGEIYLQTARKILALKDDLRHQLFDISNGESGEITLGIPTERAGYMLPRVLKRFQEKYPKVRVRMIEDKGVKLLTALEKGEADLLILPWQAQDLRGAFSGEILYYERLFLVISPGMMESSMYLPGRTDAANLDVMGRLPVIRQKKGQASRKHMDQVLKHHGLEPKTAFETSSSISAVQMAAAGYGYTIVPQRAIDVVKGTFDFLALDYEASPEFWDVTAVYRKEGYLGHLEKEVIAIIKEEFSKTRT